MRLRLRLVITLVILASQSQAQLEYQHPQLTEMSGLACSYRHTDQLWAHNDSGDSARLFRLDTNGNVLGQLLIDNANAFDWEDIASFQNSDKKAFLLMADIGDNIGLRPFVDAYLIGEPDGDAAQVALLRRYTLFYPDGPRDAEALAVDSDERFAYILSKRELHPRLYRFSLDALPDKFVPLNFLGEVRSLPSVAQHAALTARKGWNFSPTALAFSPEMDAAIVSTPQHSYYYSRSTGESWLDALNRDPIVIRDVGMSQTEAATFSCDGQYILLGSEGSPAKIKRLSRPEEK